MTLSIIAAIAGLLATLGLAFWLGRRHLDGPAFAAVLAAPVVAALAFVAAGTLTRGSAAPTIAGNSAAAQTAAADSTPATAEARAGATSPIEEMRRQGEALRRDKRYAEARELYAKITQNAPLDADAWADLGDASAAAAGGDLKAGAPAIDRALEIDPNHSKALWLKASLALQERRFANAVELWQRLLNQLPKDSDDARLVSANLEEARSLAAKQAAGR